MILKSSYCENKKSGLCSVMRGLAAVTAIAGCLAARPAFAQCEMPGTTMATAAGIVAADTASLNAQYLAPVGVLPLFYEAQIYIAQSVLMNDLKDQEKTILDRMDKFWSDWLQAQKDMTAQLNASQGDGVRQVNNLFDSSGENKNARDMQTFEIQAKKQFEPTSVGCRFDSIAPAVATTSRSAKKISVALTNDSDDLANAKKGTPAAKGPGSVQKDKWDKYTKLFCNPDNNNGKANCPAAGSLMDADVTPSKTIFGKLTIDMSDPNMKVALDTLMTNITGYKPAKPIPKDSLDRPGEIQKRIEQRSYNAQMNTVTSLVHDIEASRLPGEKSDEAQAIRQQMGVTTASDKPSERELRQAVLEQLWDPGYYVGLGDEPSTTVQKQVYLQAYDLMLLYKLVDRMEKISDIYSIQAANTLKKYQGDTRDSGTSAMPMR